jgi:hypothetical protein
MCMADMLAVTAVAEALRTPGSEPIKNTYFLYLERRARLEARSGAAGASSSTDFGNRTANRAFNFLRSTLHPKRFAYEKGPPIAPPHGRPH